MRFLVLPRIMFDTLLRGAQINFDNEPKLAKASGALLARVLLGLGRAELAFQGHDSRLVSKRFRTNQTVDRGWPLERCRVLYVFAVS